MIHPIPSGTRDVLPDEMREMRAIAEALSGVFERRGYGEVYTPALEYETVQPPLRFSYLAHCYRGVLPQRGQARELLQAGIELIGAPAPQGTAEALSVLCQALEAIGLEGYRVGLGDASLFPALMAGLGVAPEARPALLEALARRDFVELEGVLADAG